MLVSIPPDLQPRIWVYLEISGFEGEPSEITGILGVAPDEAWRQGDPIPPQPSDALYTGKLPRLRKYGNWMIKSDTVDSIDLVEHMNHIMRKLGSAVDRFAALPAAVNVRLTILISIYTDIAPNLHFNHQHVQFLAKANADVDVDFYMYVKHGEEIR